MKRALAAAMVMAAMGCESAPHALGVVTSELRPTQQDPGVPLPRFAASDRVERFVSPSGAFAIHYTREGVNAVPSADADRDGVPDFVNLTATTYDAVLVRLRDALGFRVPLGDMGATDNGGDGRFDVYLVDFAGRADGAFRQDPCPAASPTCPGHMVQENDFANYRYSTAREAIRTLASHEFFHAVQSAYRVSESITLQESTAEWSTTRFDASLDDLARLASGYLAAPDRSLDQDPTGPVDGFSYGVGLYFEHVTRHIDATVVRQLWERRAMAPMGESWLTSLDGLLQSEHQTTFAATFKDFARALIFTGSESDPARGFQLARNVSAVASTTATLPFSVDRVRLFRASSRHYRVTPPEGGAFRVVAVPAEGAEDTSLATLSAWVTCRRDGRLEDPVSYDLAAGAITVDPRGSGECRVALVNGRTTGNSAQLRLCIAAMGERTACDPPAPDAGVMGDSGTTPPPPAMMDEGGCTSRPSSRPVPLWSSALVLGALAMRRRRALA